MADQKQSGLTTVRLIVRRPDGVIEGIFPMSELTEPALAGVYMYEYTPTIAGNHLFSVFENGVWEHNKSEEATILPTNVPVAKFNT